MKKWKQTAGFTLVELIVVIAILGILAGVGTVGYSGYIKKANQTKDIQLASDIKYALQLASVTSSGNLGLGGAVVLTTDGVTYKQVDENGDMQPVADGQKANSPLYQAVIAAFGSEDALKLSYDSWDSSNASSVVADYSRSSFAGNEGDLLEDIQILTDAVDTMLNAVASEGGATAIIDLMGGGAFQTYLENQGINVSDSSAENLRKISNYATLFVADQVSNNGDANNDKIRTAWSNYNFNHDVSKSDAEIAFEMYQVYGNTGLTTVGMMAAYYANVEAMVQYINKQQENGANYDSTALENFNNAFANADFAEVADRVNSPNSGETKTAAAQNAVFEEMARTYRAMALAANSDPNLLNAVLTYNHQTDIANDAGAFVSAMGAVNESSGTIGSDLTKENLYGDGTMKNLLTGYINAGDALYGVSNGIAIIAASQDDGSYNVKAYPIDYVK